MDDFPDMFVFEKCDFAKTIYIYELFTSYHLDKADRTGNEIIYVLAVLVGQLS